MTAKIRCMCNTSTTHQHSSTDRTCTHRMQDEASNQTLPGQHETHRNGNCHTKRKPGSIAQLQEHNQSPYNHPYNNQGFKHLGQRIPDTFTQGMPVKPKGPKCDRGKGHNNNQQGNQVPKPNFDRITPSRPEPPLYEGPQEVLPD